MTTPQRWMIRPTYTLIVVAVAFIAAAVAAVAMSFSTCVWLPGWVPWCVAVGRVALAGSAILGAPMVRLQESCFCDSCCRCSPHEHPEAPVTSTASVLYFWLRIEKTAGFASRCNVTLVVATLIALVFLFALVGGFSFLCSSSLLLLRSCSSFPCCCCSTFIFLVVVVFSASPFCWFFPPIAPLQASCAYADLCLGSFGDGCVCRMVP